MSSRDSSTDSVDARILPVEPSQECPFPPLEMSLLTSPLKHSFHLRERVYQPINIVELGNKIEAFRQQYGEDSYLGRYFGADWKRSVSEVRQNDVVIVLLAQKQQRLYEYLGVPVIVLTPDMLSPRQYQLVHDKVLPKHHDLFTSSHEAAKRLDAQIDDCYFCAPRLRGKSVVLLCFIVSLSIRPASETQELPSNFEGFGVIYYETIMETAHGPRPLKNLDYSRLVGAPVVPLALGSNIGTADDSDIGASHGIVVQDKEGQSYLFNCGHVMYNEHVEGVFSSDINRKFVSVHQPSRYAYDLTSPAFRRQFGDIDPVQTIAEGELMCVSKAVETDLHTRPLNCVIGPLLLSAGDELQVDFAFLKLIDGVKYCNVHIGMEEVWSNMTPLTRSLLLHHNVHSRVDFSGHVLTIEDLQNLDLAMTTPETLFLKFGTASELTFGKLVIHPRDIISKELSPFVSRHTLMFRQGMVFLQQMESTTNGDSGSCVFNAAGDILGLIVAREREGIVVMPISPILRLLEFSINMNCDCK
ncbi:hypothetical protein RCL1_000304 [Eukaryota sp. TZLM3-RCL]